MVDLNVDYKNIKTKTALRYPGGKAKALKYILPMFPEKFNEYREPFVGGGSLFTATKQTKPNIKFKINDLNYELFCFWNQLKHNADELVDELFFIKQNYKDGRVLYNEFNNQSLEDESEFETAVRFFVLNRITFSGLSSSGGFSKESFEKRFTTSSIKRLKPLSDLTQNVKITNESYEKLLYNRGKNVFIYLDPPYFNNRESKLYGKKGHLHFSFDHVNFAKKMRKCKHKWLITCDDSPEVWELFDFANITRWKFQYGVNNHKSKDNNKVKAKIGNELFIYNF